ncbi:hypothetical protein [Actibacterium sp. D379-3]
MHAIVTDRFGPCSVAVKVIVNVDELETGRRLNIRFEKIWLHDQVLRRKSDCRPPMINAPSSAAHARRG